MTASQTLQQEQCDDDAVETLRTRLRWRPEDDTAAEASGRSLLAYAAICGDAAAVRKLVKSQSLASLEACWLNADNVFGEVGATPLMFAMGYGDNFEVVLQLLQARANPQTVMIPENMDALFCGALRGQCSHTARWLQMFDDYPVERFAKGQTPLHAACSFNGTQGVARALIAAKAHLDLVNNIGGFPLQNACFNVDSRPELIQCLIELRADVNSQGRPATKGMRMVFSVARLAVRRGSRNPVFQFLASLGGITPLMEAARGGRVNLVKELLSARADPALRNHQGLTASAMAHANFGEAIPMLDELLVPIVPAGS